MEQAEMHKSLAIPWKLNLLRPAEEPARLQESPFYSATQSKTAKKGVKTYNIEDLLECDQHKERHQGKTEETGHDPHQRSDEGKARRNQPAKGRKRKIESDNDAIPDSPCRARLPGLSRLVGASLACGADPLSASSKEPQNFLDFSSDMKRRSLEQLQSGASALVPSPFSLAAAVGGMGYPQTHAFAPPQPMLALAAPPHTSSIITSSTSAAASLAAFGAGAASLYGLLARRNVCAKCNCAFRVISDLVHHMRTHHRSSTADTDTEENTTDRSTAAMTTHVEAKRLVTTASAVGRASEGGAAGKLKCPICRERFKERHHLTRHMSSHET